MNHRQAPAPSFWVRQPGGGLYALLLIVTFMPSASAGAGELRVVLAKGSRAVYGLCLTRVMRLCYRPFFPGTFRRQAVGSLLTSALFGGLWLGIAEVWASWFSPSGSPSRRSSSSPWWTTP